MFKKSIIMVALSILAVTSALASGPTDEKAIKEQLKGFSDAWATGDAKAMAAFWAEDGDVINPTGRVGKNREEVEKLLNDEHTGIFKGTTNPMEVESVRFVKDDVAVVDASGEVRGIKKAPKGKKNLKHHLTLVMVKESDGWKTVSARPYVFLPTMQPAKRAKK